MDQQAMRIAVAEEYGIALYRQYGEEQAAHLLDIDVSTLKRWRRAGKVPYVAYGERGVRYMGYMVADILMGGVKGGNSSSGNVLMDALKGKNDG